MARGDLTPHWFVVYCQAQKEQLACRELKRIGFEVFWPHTSSWAAAGHKEKSRLVKKSWLPRYVFVRSFKENLWAVNDAAGVSTVVHAPGGEPFPVCDDVMGIIQSQADHLGEVFIGKRKRPKPKYRVGDRIRITDEKSPLFGLYVTAKKVLDSGVVHAIFHGQILGGSKIVLEDPSIGEVVKRAG